MGCRYECKKYGKQRFKCCIECEHYKYLNTANAIDRAIEIVKRGGRDEE